MIQGQQTYFQISLDILGGNTLFIGKHYPILTTEEAVAQIKNGDTVSFSGFTPAGAAKAVPVALAKRARLGIEFLDVHGRLAGWPLVPGFGVQNGLDRRSGIVLGDHVPYR